MSILKSTVIASALALGTLGAASAAQFESVPGVTGDVKVVVNGGVATLSGHLDSSFEANLAGKYIGSQAGVDRVINLVTFQ